MCDASRDRVVAFHRSPALVARFDRSERISSQFLMAYGIIIVVFYSIGAASGAGALRHQILVRNSFL